MISSCKSGGGEENSLDPAFMNSSKTDPVCSSLESLINHQCVRIVCPYINQYVEDQTCFTEPSCLDNERVVNHRCELFSCPSNQFPKNHVCTNDPVCMNDEKLFNHICIKLRCTQTEFPQNHTCVSDPVCLAGENIVNHECQPISCLPGNHPENESCVSDTRLKLCSGTSSPDTLTSNWNNQIHPGYYTQTYLNGSWPADAFSVLSLSSDSSNCAYSCNEGYTIDRNTNSCILIDRVEICGRNVFDSGEYNEALYSILRQGRYTQQWVTNGSSQGAFLPPAGIELAYGLTDTNGLCQFVCKDGSHDLFYENNSVVIGTCVSDIVENQNCPDVSADPNAVFNGSGKFTKSWDSNLKKWNEVLSTYSGDQNLACSYSCFSGFDYDGATGRCLPHVPVVSTYSGVINSSFYAQPSDVAVDSNDNVFVADTRNHVIRKIDNNGAVSIIAGKLGVSGYIMGEVPNSRIFNPEVLAFDSQNNLYAVVDHRKIVKISPAGLMESFIDIPINLDGDTIRNSNTILSMAFDSQDNLYFTYEKSIARVTRSGSTIGFEIIAGLPGELGDVNGVGSGIRLGLPTGITIDSNDNIFIADVANFKIKKLTKNSNGSFTSSTIASGMTHPLRLIFNTDGDLIVLESDSFTKITHLEMPGQAIQSFYVGDGRVGYIDGLAPVARFNFATGMAIDSMGNLYVADTQNNLIRKIK